MHVSLKGGNPVTEQMKQLLQQESYALAELCDRIDRAVDCIVKTGLEHVAEDNIVFVPDDLLARFSIDPNHDFMIQDVINDRLSERPEVFSFNTDFKKGVGSGYNIEFTEAREVMTRPATLGPARKAELFDKLLSSYEGFLEDDGVYEILRGFMTEEEIQASGFRFEQQDGLERTREVLDLLGGPDPHSLNRPRRPCKLRDVIRVPLPASTYLDHQAGYANTMPIGALDQNDLTPEQLAGWEDVLEADVVRVFHGAYGVHIEVANVDVDRLADFSFRACLGKLAEVRKEASAAGPQLSI